MTRAYCYLSTWFLGTLFFFLPALCYAQEFPDGPAHRFNLQECLDYAYLHQDSIKNSALDIESADYRVKEAIGLGLPQVSGTASLQDFLQIPTQLLPGDFFGQPGTFIPIRFGVKYQNSVTLNINQILFDGTYLVGLAASKTYKELSQRTLPEKSPADEDQHDCCRDQSLLPSTGERRANQAH